MYYNKYDIMSFYTNETDLNITIKDNNFVIKIDLENNKTLHNLIIDNCSVLSEIRFNNFEYLIIRVSNCPNLKVISNYYNNFVSKSIYLGDNLNCLERLNIYCVDKVMIKDQKMDNLSIITFHNVKDLKVDFNMFSNLKYIYLFQVTIKSLTILTDTLLCLILNCCNVQKKCIQNKNVVKTKGYFLDMIRYDKKPSHPRICDYIRIYYNPHNNYWIYIQRFINLNEKKIYVCYLPSEKLIQCST